VLDPRCIFGRVLSCLSFCAYVNMRFTNVTAVAELGCHSDNSMDARAGGCMSRMRALATRSLGSLCSVNGLAGGSVLRLHGLFLPYLCSANWLAGDMCFSWMGSR